MMSTFFPGAARHPNSNRFAAIVGCADARVPVELIFSEGPNDLFVFRVAGNGMGDDVTASLSYAVDHLKDSLRTIGILGRSGCGAVSAAVDVYLEPAKYMQIMTQKDPRQILDSILIVIQLGATWLERVYGSEVVRRRGYRTTLIEVAIALNAALTRALG
ncbi:carbonic anhydrase [Ensifer canadensis]|jgi:carbonic anhydrase|uniref:carbonic anhydrase n=1 Tax=Ensifer canadensis TaxID=555315 RepID=UPI0035E3CA71